MASNIQRRRFLRPMHRVIKSGAIGHQRSRRQNAPAVRVHNAFVDVGGETEIVGIDHQLPLSHQKIFSWMVRNFLGLARISLAND